MCQAACVSLSQLVCTTDRVMAFDLLPPCCPNRHLMPRHSPVQLPRLLSKYLTELPAWLTGGRALCAPLTPLPCRPSSGPQS